MSKSFHVADVVTATTGTLLTNSMDGLYEVISHMVGFDAMTHELPTLFDVVAPEIFKQHPQLEAIEVPKFEDPAIDVPIFTDGLVMRFGEYFELEPISTPVERVSFGEAVFRAKERRANR